jgi:hypothetical protein
MEDRLALSTLTVTNNADSGPGSLRATIAAAANGDTIVFAHDLEGGTITLNSGALHLTKNLDIMGLGSDTLTVSGHDASRVFEVSGSATVTLSDLTVSHGKALTGGGIDNAGSLTLRNMTLANNQALGGLGGGAIVNESSASLTLTDSDLTGNRATAASASVDVFGGGLLNEGRATVTRSTFSGNQALGGGGSSFFGGSVGGAIDNFGGATLMVTDSSFTSNQALGAAGQGNFGIGGAIENNAGFDQTVPSMATINNSSFINNVASGADGVTGNGGALDNEGTGATMVLSNSVLVGNQSIGAAGGAEGRGGGILNVFGSNLTILSCWLANNRAAATGAVGTFLDGRGIGGGIDNEVNSTLTIRDSWLTGNQAIGGDGSTLVGANVGDGAGGGIDNGDASFGGATLTVIHCTISDNLARGGSTNAERGGTGQGGGISNVSGALTIMNSTVTGNVAQGGTGASSSQNGFGLGGGIATLVDATGSVMGSTLIGNAAIGATGASGGNGGLGVGGGISVGQMGGPDSSSLRLNDSTLDDNEALGGAGGTVAAAAPA